MEYLSHTRNHPFELSGNYSRNLSSSTQFPDITMKHNNLVRTNIMEFYKQPGSLRRSMTMLGTSTTGGSNDAGGSLTRVETIIPVVKQDLTKSAIIRGSLYELEGLRVPTHTAVPYSSNRTALYTRYALNDWSKQSQRLYGNSDQARGTAEHIRGDSLRLGRHLDETTNHKQQDSTKKLGARVDDIDYLKAELDREIHNSIEESDKLSRSKIVAEKALLETENPLAATQHCLYVREKRAKIDLVHDEVEKELLNEINTIKQCQDEINHLIKKAGQQLKNNRIAQHNLEKDSRDKYQALKIDEAARNLKNHSAGLAYHHGIQYVNNCQSTPESWARFTRSNIDQSISEREASAKLREDIDVCLQRAQECMRKQWLQVNQALSRRIQEVVTARNGDQDHLNKIQQELFETEKNIEYLKKAVQDKQAPLKVAQTRLSLRLDRPNMEACDDVPRNKLIEEVEEILQSIDNLQKQLRVTETSHNNLLINKRDLEEDIAVKNNSIFIDREQCLGTRKTLTILREDFM